MNLKFAISLGLMIISLNSQAASDTNYETPASHKLDHLREELLLSPEQTAKIDAIFKAQHEKFAAIHRESHDKVTEVLNPEQAAKWEEMRRKHQAQLQKPAP